jgi:transposase
VAIYSREAHIVFGGQARNKLLRYPAVLYRIEGDAGAAEHAAHRLGLRQKRARRVMAGLRRRLDATAAAVRPKTAVGKACLYALGQWDALQVYLEHGEAPIDNNGVERRRAHR